MIILSNAKQLETKKVKERKICSLESKYQDQQVVLENWNNSNHHFLWDFYLYFVDNDVLWSFFQLKNKRKTRNLKEGEYIDLNTGTNTSMLCLKFVINLFIISYMTFYLYHVDNDVLWSFFQIQNKLKTRKLKEGGY